MSRSCRTYPWYALPLRGFTFHHSVPFHCTSTPSPGARIVTTADSRFGAARMLVRPRGVVRACFQGASAAGVSGAGEAVGGRETVGEEGGGGGADGGEGDGGDDGAAA